MRCILLQCLLLSRSKTVLVSGTIAGASHGSHANESREAPEKEITYSRSRKYNRLTIANISRMFFLLES